MSEPRTTVKVSFAESTMVALHRLAAARGQTMGQTIRDALALQQWLQERRQAGDEVLLKHPDGTYSKIVFRS